MRNEPAFPAVSGPFPDVICGNAVGQLISDLEWVEAVLIRLKLDRIEWFSPGLLRPVKFTDQGNPDD